MFHDTVDKSFADSPFAHIHSCSTYRQILLRHKVFKVENEVTSVSSTHQKTQRTHRWLCLTDTAIHVGVNSCVEALTYKAGFIITAWGEIETTCKETGCCSARKHATIAQNWLYK